MVNVFANGFDVDVERVQDTVTTALNQHGITGNYEVNVNFITLTEMQNLYDKKPHDVLSFPLEKEIGPDGVTRLGDIVVLGSLLPAKRDHWITHACLHLLGIHHK